MSVVPFNINGQEIQISGNLENPRVVWITDGVGKQMVSSTEDYGFDAADQLVVFPEGRFGDVTTFFDQKQHELAAVSGIVFFLFGADEISQPLQSFEAVTSSSIHCFDGYFHPRGPRELPRLPVHEVVDAYNGVIDRILVQFPSSSVFTTEPSLRRSKHGFAAARAIEVGRKIKRRDERHHHATVLRQLHAVIRGKAEGDRLGGRYPINEEFFDEDGVRMTPTALRSSLVRIMAFVGTELRLPGDWGNPRAIEGMSVAF